MDYYFQMKDLAVGYHKQALIHDININIEKGEIVTLIGPNGSGKSTILKSITRQLELIGGRVYIASRDLQGLSYKTLSTEMAVVLTERIRPELMTCHDIVATGRYPYTGRLGVLSREDEDKVDQAMKAVHAVELGGRDFNAISDGQRQRVLLARAICQEPDMIILDEPTSFLDIRHKLDLLSILRSMAKEKGITVVMSLHEIDLAQKIADKIICVKGFYDPVFGSIELPRPKGEPKVFVISGAGSGIPVYRSLQKEGIPFAAGILYTNDIDYRLAKELAAQTVTEQPFSEISKETYEQALILMKKCQRVIVTDVPEGTCNHRLFDLIKEARRLGMA